ncbi:glycosyltransferase family 4 protein [Flavobacterium agrisoli]|uniref:Glycosyltransferase family 4 protein n=1 Tax=Flavobacterium agrisoli TaxID=2793066 RepID=A0A934PQY6_9FLAO|nr:glycosyltransferase family 4 protein [Flavobacterium agrisoli]MBK0371284.1 glycosyltransferase family 4 protein [Flavobacterium agrisoli]
MKQNKLIRITTVPISLDKLLSGQLKFMSSFYEVIAVSSDSNALNKISKKEEVKTFAVEMTRKITPLQDLKAVWHLYQFFKREQPLIVHTHTPKAGTVGMIAAKLARVPHRLHTVAGLPLLEATGNKRKLLNFVEKITYKCATKIYPNSFGLKDIIIQEQFCQPEKLKVLANGSSNGIDTTHFNCSHFSKEDNQKLREKWNIHPDNFVFVFVGRLVGDKGINELIDAFCKLETLGAKLLLVGSLESELDALHQTTLDAIATNTSIISVGFQSDVRPYFAISDALVFPSYREGFPNVVMQAGAMGLPSIVSNINGCNEIIVEGENGMIIPVKDSAAIYDAMQKMLQNESYRHKLQAKARPMIVNRYEQKVVWEAILAEYKSLERYV